MVFLILPYLYFLPLVVVLTRKTIWRGISSTSTQIWKAPQGQQVVFARLPGSLVLHIHPVSHQHTHTMGFQRHQAQHFLQAGHRHIIYFLNHKREIQSQSFAGKRVSATLKAGKGETENWQVFTPRHLGRRFPGQRVGRQRGSSGREKSSPQLCQAQADRWGSAASSWELGRVLVLIWISLCEELWSLFLPEGVRKAGKSYGRAASWQTQGVQSHKCLRALITSTSIRTSSVTTGWAPTQPSGGDLHTTRMAHGPRSSAPFPPGNPLLNPAQRQHALWTSASSQNIEKKKTS